MRRTYVTLGLERGGTSAIAGAQRALGVHLGNVTGKNNEDYAFHEAPVEELRRVVAERDGQRDVWGFKYPHAGEFLPLLERSLRNPFYIVVFRDPVATLLSRARWDGEETERPAMMALFDAGVRGRANLSFAEATNRPCLLVSSPLAESRMDDLIDELAEFLGADVPRGDFRDRLRAYLEPGQYKSFEEFFPERCGHEEGVST